MDYFTFNAKKQGIPVNARTPYEPRRQDKIAYPFHTSEHAKKAATAIRASKS